MVVQNRPSDDRGLDRQFFHYYRSISSKGQQIGVSSIGQPRSTQLALTSTSHFNLQRQNGRGIQFSRDATLLQNQPEPIDLELMLTALADLLMEGIQRNQPFTVFCLARTLDSQSTILWPCFGLDRWRKGIATVTTELFSPSLYTSYQLEHVEPHITVHIESMT